MKTTTLVAILGVLACAASVNSALIHKKPAPMDPVSEVDLGTALKLYYKALQSIMPCGYEPLQMPIMAPMTVKNFNFHVDNNHSRITANFSDMYLTGLNLAEFVKFEYDEKTGVLEYDINVPELQVLGEYSLDAWLLMAGLGVQMNGDGLLNMKITDYRVVGHFKLAPNVQNYLTMTDNAVDLFIGDIEFHNWNRKWDIALNNYYNEFLRNYVLILVQELEPALTSLYNKYLLPLENEALAAVTPEQFVNVLLSITDQLNSVHCSAN